MRRLKKAGILVSAIAVAAIGGAVLSTALSPTAGADQESEADRIAEFEEGFADVERNENGQTYGPVRDGDVEAGTLPDLILVVGNSGVEGYVYQEVLFPPLNTLPSGAEEAARWNEEQSQGKDVPVYASDGKTQIDTFTLQGFEEKS